MSEPADPVTPASRAGEVDNLVGALVAPRAAFEAIARRPTWLLALCLLAALGAAVIWASYSKVEASGFRTYLEDMGRSLPDSVSDEQILGWTRVTSVVGAALFAPLTYLAVAGIFLGLLRMAGGELDFRKSLAVTVHGFLPFAVAAVVGLVMATFRTEITMQEIESGALVPSHLGFLAGPGVGAVTRALLTSVDLFSAWCIALLGLGYAIVARVPKGKAFGVVAAVWGLGILIKVVLAALR
jgi:hypothetical protein